MKKTAFLICASLMITLLAFISADAQEDMVIINSDGFDSPQRTNHPKTRAARIAMNGKRPVGSLP